MDPKKNENKETPMAVTKKTGDLMGKDVAKKIFRDICEDLQLDMDFFTDEDDETKAQIKKIIASIQQGYLEYKDEVFTLKLRKPVKTGDTQITRLIIKEPTGVQLRGMSSVKKKNDDVGKAMAVLGEVTELGLPVINKLKSRDMMVAVGIISLFL